MKAIVFLVASLPQWGDKPPHKKFLNVDPSLTFRIISYFFCKVFCDSFSRRVYRSIFSPLVFRSGFPIDSAYFPRGLDWSLGQVTDPRWKRWWKPRTYLDRWKIGHELLDHVLSIYLTISIYLYLSLSISIYLYLSLSISIYLYLSLSISIYLYLSLSISICLSVCLSVCLSLSISFYLYLSIYWL